MCESCGTHTHTKENIGDVEEKKNKILYQWKKIGKSNNTTKEEKRLIIKSNDNMKAKSAKSLLTECVIPTYIAVVLVDV